jgi:hypothetical protein
VRYQARLMIASATRYWFTTYPTPLAEVGVRAI